MQYCWVAAALIPSWLFPGLRSKRLPDAEFDPHLWFPASIITSATPAAHIPGGSIALPEEMGVLGLSLACCVAESGRYGERSPMFGPCHAHCPFVSMEHAPSYTGACDAFAASLLIRRKLICSQNRLLYLKYIWELTII